MLVGVLLTWWMMDTADGAEKKSKPFEVKGKMSQSNITSEYEKILRLPAESLENTFKIFSTETIFFQFQQLKSSSCPITLECIRLVHKAW